MKYLVWSNEHRGWWKPTRHGYTTRTDKAGHFSFEAAMDITTNANRHLRPGDDPNEIMLPAPSRDQIRLDLEYPDR